MKLPFFSLLILLAIAGWYFYLTPTEENNLEYNREQGEVFVYETEAESADDCSSYEQYDAESNVCYYECEDEATCENIAKEIDAEIATWFEEWENTNLEEDPISNNSDTLRAEYHVWSWEKIILKNGASNQEDLEIWNLISKISPNWLSDTYIDTFQIFDNKEDDTLAFVDDEESDGKWRIGVNIATFGEESEKEKNLTIVHELGHIITLNNSQLDAKKSASQCEISYLDEGCPNASSYLGGFIKLFWTPEDIAESEKTSSGLYEKNPSNFITEYASTNFTEDIAESLAYFVFGEQNIKKTTVAVKKQQYFSQFPELIKTRQEMINGVKSNIIRARKK